LNCPFLPRVFCDFARSSNHTVTCLLVACLGFWTGCSTAPATTASRNTESDGVFQKLAQLDLSSNRLIMAIAEQDDVVGFSQQLQQQSGFDSALTPFDLERVKQSLVRSIKIVLDDETTAQFVETHLAQHYASTLTTAEALTLVEGYENEVIKNSAKLQELRHLFVADRLGDLLHAQWRPFKIPSQGMVPTLLPGDYIFVNKVAYQSTEPQAGDIIVFPYPEDETKVFVKRVVGLPHDRIEIRDKEVYLNGKSLTESYIQHTDPSILPENPRDKLGPVTMPSNAYFVMGDNRDSSLDSRFWGYVSKDKILGKAVVIYWSVDPNTKTPRWNRLNHLVR